MPPERLLPPDSAKELVARLIGQHRGALASAYPSCGVNQANALERQLASGAVSATVWRSAEGDASGLAWFDSARDEDRIHGLLLEPWSLAHLTAFLDDFERERSRRTVAVTDLIPGFPDEDQVPYFEPRGFWHRSKVLMRRGPEAPPPPPGTSPSLRGIESRDLEPIADVYVAAYSERAGEFWTWNRDDRAARDDALRDVGGQVTEAGGWAPRFLPEASLVWEESGCVLGAVLVERGANGAPWIADLVVDPRAQRRGIGRALLEQAVVVLSRGNATAIELCAIRLGAPYHLYRRLGFEDVSGPRGRLDGHWVRGTSPV